MGKKHFKNFCIGLLCAGALFALVSNVAAAAEKKVKGTDAPKIGQFSTEDPTRLKDKGTTEPYGYTYIPYAPAQVNMQFGMTGITTYSNTSGVALINPNSLVISDVLLNGRVEITLPGPPPTTETTGELGSEGGGRFDLTMSRDGRTAVISNFGDSTVYFVDLSGGTPLVSGKVQVDFFAEDLAIDPSGQWLLVTDGGFTARVGVIHIPTRTRLTYHDDDDDNPLTPIENDDGDPTEPDIPTYSWRIYNAMDPDDPLDDMTGYANSVDIAADGRTVIVTDYFAGQIHVLLLDPADGSLSLEQTETLWRQGQDGSEAHPFLYRPVNSAISPDGRTVLLANASNSDISMALNEGCNLAAFYIDQPGHVLRTPDVIFPYDSENLIGIMGGQSIAFSRDGSKAYYLTVYWDEALTPPEGLTPEELADFWTYSYWNYPEIQVLNIAGAGQASWTGSIRLPTKRGTSQLFGVDTMATSPDGTYLFTTNPTLSGASPVIDVVNLRTMSLAKQIGTPTEYQDPLHPDDPTELLYLLPTGIAFPEAPINLGVSLDVGEGQSPPDEEFSFQVILKNPSVAPAFGISVGCELPEGMEIVSTSGDNGSWNSEYGFWSIPALGSGQTAILTVTAKCSTTGSKLIRFFINHQAGYDPIGSDNRAEATIRILGKADLAISGEVSSATPIVSSPFTVSLTAGNAGPLAGVNVTVSQPLPDGWTVVSSSGSGSYNKITGLWTIGALPVGGSASLQLTLQSSVLGSTVLSFPIGDSGTYDPKESDNQLALAVQIVKVAPPLDAGVQKFENDLIFTKELFNKLTWQHNPANNAVSGYKILFKLKSAADSSYSQLTVTAASATQYAHRNLAAGQSYSYKIIAVNASGDESPAVVVEN